MILQLSLLLRLISPEGDQLEQNRGNSELLHLRLSRIVVRLLTSDLEVGVQSQSMTLPLQYNNSRTKHTTYMKLGGQTNLNMRNPSMMLTMMLHDHKQT